MLLFFRAHALQVVLCTQRAELFGAGGDEAQAVGGGDALQALRQFQHYADAGGVVVDALQRQAAEVVIQIFVALRRVGVEVGDDHYLFRTVAVAGGDHRAGGDVVPVLLAVFAGVEIARVDAANVALVTHLAELLLQVVGGEQFGRAARHAAGEVSGDVAGLFGGETAHWRVFCGLCGTNAEDAAECEGQQAGLQVKRENIPKNPSLLSALPIIFCGTQYETPGGITQFPRLLIFARMRKPPPQLSPFASGVAAYIP